MFPIALLLAFLAPPTLDDAGFEGPDPLRSWKTWIYKDGKDPAILADGSQAHEGKRSLLIAADEPADVALGQVIELPAGSVWIARCWIRTEDLRPRDPTEVGGALHVQTPEGATLARGPGRFGTTPWGETSVAFRVPPAGKVKIVLFHIGYGKGTGKAWFDGVRLEEAPRTGPERIRVFPERTSTLPIDPKHVGQFIEPLCNLIPSLLDQRVANTSFEVEPPWNVAFRREVDRRPRPWYPDGAVHVARFARDPEGAFNGKLSQRIEVLAPGARAGISQDGIWLEEGAYYKLRLHARGAGAPKPRAWLHGGGGTVAEPAALGEVGAEWKPLEATLRATRSIEDATLTIDFEGPGTLWLDRVYMVGTDAVLGLWRKDAVATLRAMTPGAIRFGGSALETYEWDACIGSWDQRVPFPQTYWGGIEEDFVGVEEFVQLCREVDAEPLVCVRWTGKTPEDAAAQVEYFNGSPETPWGSRRAANGRKEPYGIKYWQVGNEVSGAEYEASLPEFAAAMRRADPSIKILSAFPSEATLRPDGAGVDYLCPHHYGCADLAGTAGNLAELARWIDRAGAKGRVRVAVTEWNTTAGDWELGRAALQTLGNALAVARYHNLLHRNADLVEIAIRSNLVDSFCSGSFVTGPGWLYKAPSWHAQALYARASGSFPLRVERSTPFQWPVAEPDLSATLDPDGRTLRIYAVNSTAEPIEVVCVLSGFRASPAGATLRVLRDSLGARSAEVLNGRDEPERVRVFASEATVRGNEVPLRLEPFSLTLLEASLGVQ